MTVPHPVPLAHASPGRLTRILEGSGFTFDAVKSRLGTQYRQWPPKGAGVAGEFLARLHGASMRADIGARMLSPATSDILGRVSSYFKNRGPKDQLDSLIWLFLFNEPVKETALRHIFSPSDLNALADMNLIRFDAGAAVCDLALFECAGAFLATDAKVKPPANVNRVMPLIPESFDFVGSVSRKPVNSVLDLCTGSGVHALLAARHAKHVVATDISPRALHFAKFNAWFNGVTNIEFRQGDLFGAVEGRGFDLILANPPYMPDTRSSPNDNFYCGGKSGDILWSQILRGLEKHLLPGGLCQIIHMVVLLGNETYEGKVRALLGRFADFCGVLSCSNPICFPNANTAAATSVHFGVTTIKRYRTPGTAFYLRAPFHTPLLFDVSDLLVALDQASSPEGRALVCERHFAKSRPKRILPATGTLIGAASFAAFCALLLRGAWRVFQGMWKRRRDRVLRSRSRNRSAQLS
jgi:methylase of polypeptide subunit release factors